MEYTPNLGLRFLVPYQAQKELTVNDGLLKIDAILNTGVRGGENQNEPPSNAALGSLWIIGSKPKDEWHGHNNELAYFFDIWRFIKPNTGCMFWNLDMNALNIFDGSKWQTQIIGEK